MVYQEHQVANINCLTPPLFLILWRLKKMKIWKIEALPKIKLKYHKILAYSLKCKNTQSS